MFIIDIQSIGIGKLAAGIICGTCFAVATVGGIAVSVQNNGRIAMGVSSEGTTLAGMTRDEAAQWFKNQAQAKLQHQALTLTYGQKKFNIAPADIQLQAEADQAADAAYAIGRDASLPANLLNQMRYAITGKNIAMTATYNEQALHDKLQTIKQQIDTPPKDAYVEVQGDGTIKHMPEVVGKTTDMDAVQQEADPKLRQLKLTFKKELTPDEEQPRITDEDVAPIQNVLATYTTTFRPGDRATNIRIAADKLHDVMVRSGGVFSFNDTVGPRTRAAGYKNAGVIVDGQHAIDVGGGVCQVSSKLYNAVLLAGLTPTIRTPHFFPSTYCPPGRDATVADGLLDFQFRNDLAHNVILKVALTTNSITFYVLGNKNDLGGQTIRLTNRGSGSHPSIYRLWYLGDNVAREEFLHTDNYN